MSNSQPRRRWPRILLTAVLVVAIVAGAAYAWGAYSSKNAATTAMAATTAGTVAIQPLDVAKSAVSASGNLELVDERSVALGASGIVRTVAVKVGDAVQAGQTLLQLDTTDLERAYSQALLSVESANLALADLQTPATDAELSTAQANLETAQQNLVDLQTGTSGEEVAAARSALAAAQLSYSEDQAGPSADELTQLSASLHKNEIALADAQRAYDKVAWRGGDSAESVALQSATIDYESAKAAFDQSTAPSSGSSVQSALSNIQSAQVKLDDLLTSPTQAAIAAAQAQVSTAQAALDDMQRGPTESELRAKQIALEQSLIALEQAARELDAATLTAPIAGVIITINAAVGERSAADSVVMSIANPTDLQLVINVAEADIPYVTLGQAATIEIDALPGKSFTGEVAAIAPINNSTSGSVTYPVTVHLTDSALTGVLPGMNSVATLTSEVAASADSWLVPSNAISSDGATSTVVVVRDGATSAVPVTPAGVQGEWTIVQAPTLQAGDEVVGSLVSKLDSNTFGGNRTGGAMPFGGGGGGPPPGGG